MLHLRCPMGMLTALIIWCPHPHPQLWICGWWRSFASSTGHMHNNSNLPSYTTVDTCYSSFSLQKTSRWAMLTGTPRVWRRPVALMSPGRPPGELSILKGNYNMVPFQCKLYPNYNPVPFRYKDKMPCQNFIPMGFGAFFSSHASQSELQRSW